MIQSFIVYSSIELRNKTGSDLVDEKYECSICGTVLTKEIMDSGKTSIFSLGDFKELLLCSDECRKTMSTGFYNGCLV